MNKSLMDYETFSLGDLALSSGAVLRQAFIAYKTYGRLNEKRNNCILFPTYFTGTHRSNEAIIGPGKALDTDRWFVVVPNLIGNGVSVSPSNASLEQRGPNFPTCSIHDNVRCQHQLITEHLQVREIALALGWSMGALQVYHWAVCYPDLIKNLLPICGSARCAPHNQVFIDGLMACLRADPLYTAADPARPPVNGLKAFGRVYAGWAFSQRYFREGRYRESGFDHIEDLLLAWEDDHLAWDAYDLAAKLATWRSADPSLFAGPVSQDGDHVDALADALGRIKARTVVMPCDHDLYFTLEDNAFECGLIPGAMLKPIHSNLGHCAGAPGRFHSESVFVANTIADLLTGRTI